MKNGISVILRCARFATPDHSLEQGSIAQLSTGSYESLHIVCLPTTAPLMCNTTAAQLSHAGVLVLHVELGHKSYDHVDFSCSLTALYPAGAASERCWRHRYLLLPFIIFFLFFAHPDLRRAPGPFNVLPRHPQCPAQ